MKIGSKLKELRTSHGYTQEDLAAILNVSRSTISSWEINRTYPDLSMLVSLSELYEITVDQLINEDDKLVDTITNQAKTNNTFKKVILSLSIIIVTLSLAVVFILVQQSNPNESEISSYDFSDYPKLTRQQDDTYYYKDAFVEEITDKLPDGTETSLGQSPHRNIHYADQVTLNIRRDSDHEINKMEIISKKSSKQILEEEHGTKIYSEKYLSLEEVKTNLTESSPELKKGTNDELVFVRNEGQHYFAYFKSK